MLKSVTYKDTEFRTELEARVAVLLDELGADWEYMPEKSVNGKIYYMPDFIVRGVAGRVDGDLWIEVKSKPQDWTKEYAEIIISLSGVDEVVHDDDPVRLLRTPVFIIDRILRPSESLLNNIETMNGLFRELWKVAIGFDIGNDLFSYSFYTIDRDMWSALPAVNKNGEFEIVGTTAVETAVIDLEKTAQAYSKALNYRFECKNNGYNLLNVLGEISGTLKEIRQEIAELKDAKELKEV